MPFEVLIPREQTLANIALVNPRTALSAFALISAAPTLMLSCHRLLRNSRVCSALSKIEEAMRRAKLVRCVSALGGRARGELLCVRMYKRGGRSC